MKISVRWSVAVVVIAFGAFFFFWSVLPGPRSPLMRYDRKMQAQYDQLAVGITFEEACARLSKRPYQTNTSFCLPQYKGFEDEFAKTNGISTEVYYLWLNGGNWYYCIGFDINNQMVVKGQGHS